MSKPTRYVPAVEIGVVLEGLDPNKTYITEIYNGIWKYFPDWDEVHFDEEKQQYVKIHQFGKEAFDTTEQLQAAGLDSKRTDVVTHWFLIGEESVGGYFTLREYGATDPIMRIDFDATGLKIKPADSEEE